MQHEDDAAVSPHGFDYSPPAPLSAYVVVLAEGPLLWSGGLCGWLALLGCVRPAARPFGGPVLAAFSVGGCLAITLAFELTYFRDAFELLQRALEVDQPVRTTPWVVPFLSGALGSELYGRTAARGAPPSE